MLPFFYSAPGSPVLSAQLNSVIAQDDIVLDNGTWGAHGGSELSSIGGTIQLGELLPNTPLIRHALELQLCASIYYYDQPPSYMWSALNCDGYAFDRNYTGHYGGKDIYVSPGALLAIPSNITVNVSTTPSQKLLFALQNYHEYLCDDTFVNCDTLDMA